MCVKISTFTKTGLKFGVASWINQLMEKLATAGGLITVTPAMHAAASGGQLSHSLLHF